MQNANAGKAGLRAAPWMWALVAVLLVLAWQTLTVHANYAGNWTGLFCTGRLVRAPDSLAPATWRDASSRGYDGQYYRFIAHDPFLRLGTAAYLDAPLLRSRRILVPLLAWVVAGGRQELVDIAYVLVVAAFIFGGVYWLGGLMVEQRRHAACGLLFLAVPATIVSIDRMTVDVALAALTACFAYQLTAGRERGLWFTLAAAGLVRPVCCWPPPAYWPRCSGATSAKQPSGRSRPFRRWAGTVTSSGLCRRPP